MGIFYIKMDNLILYNCKEQKYPLIINQLSINFSSFMNQDS